MSKQSLTTDIVSVFIYGLGKSRAECSCGWEGKLRWTRGRAVLDALMHAMDTGCRENWPLVFRHRGEPPVSARRRSPWWIWTTAAGVLIGSALYYSAPAAHADAANDYATANADVICQTIAEEPYVSTVKAVVDAIAIDTGSYEFAGKVLADAVVNYCPWNRGTVQRWVAVYTLAHAKQQPMPGSMGGRI
jgi:hypothetical protein